MAAMKNRFLSSTLMGTSALFGSIAINDATRAYGQGGEYGLSATPVSYEATAATSSLEARLEELESIVRGQQNTIQDQQAQLDAVHSEVLTQQAANGEPAASSTKYPTAKIGGQYRLMYNSSNFAFHQQQITDNQDSATYFNQRFRTWVTVQTSEHIRGYLQAEMGHILWGNEDLDFPKTYSVASPRDLTGVEMRFGYLEYEHDDVGLLRAGIQGWNDPFGQVLASSDWDFCVGGLTWKYPLSSDVTFHSGLFQLAENNVRFADDAYLWVNDLDVAVTDDRSWGISGYYLHDKGGYSYPTVTNYDSSWDVWLGIRGTQRVPIGKVNAFAIYNGGARQDIGAVPKVQHDGAALKIELADVHVGPGKFSTQAVYSTGNRSGGSHSNEFRTIAQSARDNFGSQGYWSYLIITSPHGPSDVEDLGVSLQNRGLGLFTLQSKYEIPLTERFSTISSAGWVQSDAINPVSQSRDMGTELVQAFRFAFGPGLASDFGAAVFFTGDFYGTAAGGPRPDDLYEVFTRVQLDF